MTMTTPEPSATAEWADYQKHLAQAGNLPFLGSLFIYTVSGTSVDYGLIEKLVKDSGLDPKLMPRVPADSDVFRRVFTNGERRRINLGPDKSQRLLVREVSSTSERLVKRIVAEDVDGDNLVLDYNECVEVQWNKNHPERITVSEITPNAAASLLANDLAGVYGKERRHLNGDHLRNIIVKCLDACHAVAVREGGSVYFVPAKFNAQVVALEKFGHALDDVFVHSVPLVDDRKQQGFIRDSFRAEATTDVQKLVAEVVTMLKSGDTITPRKFATLNKRYVALRGKAKEYGEVLKHEQGVAEIGLETLSKHMGTLFSKVVVTSD